MIDLQTCYVLLDGLVCRISVLDDRWHEADAEHRPGIEECRQESLKAMKAVNKHVRDLLLGR
jgi:hypothetical protein